MPILPTKDGKDDELAARTSMRVKYCGRGRGTGKPEKALVTNIPNGKSLYQSTAHTPGALVSDRHGQQREHRTYPGDKAGQRNLA